MNNNDTISLPCIVVEQAIEALTNCTCEYGHRCNRCDSEVDEGGNVAALSAALEQLQAEQELVSKSDNYLNGYCAGRTDLLKEQQREQEPVAWIFNNVELPNVKFLEWQNNPLGYRGEWIKTPLYTNPPPKRQPLTEDEIFSAIRPLCNSDTNCKAIIGISMDEYRAIESAHGIECKK